MKTAVSVTAFVCVAGLLLAVRSNQGTYDDDAGVVAAWVFSVSLTILIWLGIAWLVRWAWHRGLPRLRAGLRGWWDNGR
jgi:hypothetical protein